MGIACRRISRKKGLITEYFYGLITEYALPRRSLGSAVKNCTHAYVLQNFIIMVFRLTFRFPSAPDSPGLFPDRHPIRLTMCLLQTTPSLLYLLLILIDRRGQHHRGLIDIHRTSTPTLDYVGHLPSATGSDVPMFRSAGFINL